MKRPKEITLENANQVYDWHEQHESNSRLVKSLGFVAEKLLRTRHEFLEGSRAAIEQYAETGKGAAVSLGHAEWIDPGHYARVCRREKGLRGILDSVIVPAGAGWSNLPLVGALIMHAGTVTAFREDDVYKRQGLPRTAANEAARLMANRRMVDITIQKYRHGSHMPYFPEGTRNRGNQRKIQPIKGGMVRAINQINAPEGDGVMAVFMSVYYGDKPYGEKSWRELRNATVGIGCIALSAGENLTKGMVHAKQQQCLDLAVEMHEERSAGV